MSGVVWGDMTELEKQEASEAARAEVPPRAGGGARPDPDAGQGRDTADGSASDPAGTVQPLADEAVATAARRGRRRRPSGSAPPLPRSLGATGKVWLGLVLLLGVALAWLAGNKQPQVAADFEAAVLRAFASLRSDGLTSILRTLNTLATGWTTTVLGWGTVVALVVFRRWRHLFTFIGSITVMELLASAIYIAMSRPRPYDVTTIAGWDGFAAPSFPMAVLATVLLGMAYSLVPRGRLRQVAKLVIGLVLAVVAFARLYLAVDHPSDIVWGIVLGVAIPLVAFRWFTPNEAFPVTYRRGKTAHLDVSGARGQAIRRAIADQLGLTVLDVKPIGLEASGGSTPLRLRIAGDPDTYVFAKLYAKSHVRADRWYKLGRTILYGSL
jgi:hypothetical protein